MKDIHRNYKIKAKPGEIYAALTNSFSIELWTGARAIMVAREGTEFSVFDGDIEGMNLEFEKDRKIVQEWYFGDREEKSIVTIILVPDRHFTNIELTQTNIPNDAYEDMLYGWNNYYFGGLKDYFEK